MASSEFSSSDALKKVIPGAEIGAYKDALSALDAETRRIIANFDVKDGLGLSTYRRLQGEISSLEQASRKIIELATSTGVGMAESDLYPFIEYIRRKTDQYIADLNQYPVVVDAGKPPVRLEDIGLSHHLEETLKLRVQLAKGAAPDTQREAYRKLKASPAARFSPDIMTKVQGLNTEFPGIADVDPPLAKEALLLDVQVKGVASTEVAQLKRLLEAKKKQLANVTVADPTAPVVEGKSPPKRKLFLGDLKTIFIINNAGTAVNDFLVQRLQKTQLYENSAANNAPNEQMHSEILMFLLQLKASLEKLETEAEDWKKLNDELGGTAAVSFDDFFSEYGLTPARAQELLQVINTIVDINQTPPVTEWSNSILESIFLYGSKTEGESGVNFFARIKAKIDSGQALTDQEKKDLDRLLKYTKSQTTAVNLTIYNDVTNQEYTAKLKGAQRKKLEVAMAEIEQYAQRGGAVQVEVVEGDEEIEAVPKAVWEIYTILRSEGHNPNLPSPEAIQQMGFPAFMDNLQIAIYNFFYNTQLKASINSGGVPLRNPGSTKVNLWDEVEFNIGSKTTDRNLKFFFDKFPWKKMFGAEVPSKFQLKDTWENRMYAISSLHNLASEIQKAIDTSGQTPEIIQRVISIFTGVDTGDSRGGPFYAWALDAIYGVQGGENQGINERWCIGQLVIHFLSVFETDVKSLSSKESDKRDVAVRAAKKRAIATVPEEFRVKNDKGEYIDDATLEFAWDVATWTNFALLRLARLDQGGLDTKLPHALGTLDYLPKVISPDQSNTGTLWRPTAEQVVRILPTRDEVVKFYVDLDPNIYKQYDIEDIINESVEHEFLALSTEEHRSRAADTNLSPAQRQRHQQLVNAPLAEAERAKHAKLQAGLDEFIITMRKKSVGSLEGLHQLGSYDDLESHIHKIEGYIHKLQDELNKGETSRSLINRHKVKHYTAFVEVLKHAQSKAESMFGKDKKDDKLDHMIRAALNFSVNSRYRIIRFKDSARILGGKGIPEEEVLPIAITEGKFRVAKNRAPGQADFEKRTHKRARTIPLSYKEIATSRLNPEYVNWNSVTPLNSEVYGAIWKNFEFIFKGLNVQDPNALFPPLDNVMAGIVARYSETDWQAFLHDIDMTVLKGKLAVETLVRAARSKPKNKKEERERARADRKRVIEIAMEIDHAMGHHVWVNEITQLELFKGVKKEMEGIARLALYKVTQDGRYAVGPAAGAIGPQALEGESQVSESEIIAQMFSQPYQDENGNLSDFIDEHSDPAEWKTVLSTKLGDPKVRDLSDLLELEEGRITAVQAGINQMIVELMRVCLGMYLDQYRYDKAKEPGPAPWNLEFAKKNINTVSGAKALSFVERVFFVELCKSVFATFARPEFGGSADGVDENSPVGIIHAYDGEQIAYELLLERGLIGPQSIVVDLLRAEEFHHMPTPSQQAKADKHKK